MTNASRSKDRRRPSDRGDFGYARNRDLLFDAIAKLWMKRRDEGMTQKDIAVILNRDPAWVSRQLKGPGNWTLRTVGELVEALDGELEVAIADLKAGLPIGANFDAYSSYRPLEPNIACVVPVAPAPTINITPRATYSWVDNPVNTMVVK